MEEMAASKSRWRAGGTFGSADFSALAGIIQVVQSFRFKVQSSPICNAAGRLVNARIDFAAHHAAMPANTALAGGDEIEQSRGVDGIKFLARLGRCLREILAGQKE